MGTVNLDKASRAAPASGDPWLRGVILRLLVLNAIVSVAGIGTGVVALYAALTQANATQAQLEASVRPELVLARSYSPEEEAKFRFIASNNGSGPARMRAMRLTVDGKAVRNWSEFLAHFRALSDAEFGQNQITGRLVQSNQAIDVFVSNDPELSADLFAQADSIQIEMCYCSVFEQCWLPPNAANGLPLAVEQCPDFADEQFEQ